MQASNTILGRNPALWAALLGTILNVLAFYFTWDPQGVLLIDAAGLAAIGVLANSSDGGTVSTLAASKTAPKV